MEDKQLEEHILLLEKQVMEYDYQKLSSLLAEDFREFGNSGTKYTKQDQLDSVINKNSPKHNNRFSVTEFKVNMLSPDVVLATYKTLRERDLKQSLRSSIWQNNGERWQMTFHQGTPTS